MGLGLVILMLDFLGRGVAVVGFGHLSGNKSDAEYVIFSGHDASSEKQEELRSWIGLCGRSKSNKESGLGD